MSECAGLEDQRKIEPSSSSNNRLLARRRTRSFNSNCSSGSCTKSLLPYELTPLCIPKRGDCDCTCGLLNVAKGESESIRHVRSTERQSTEVALICLRRLVASRLGPDYSLLTDQMMREGADGDPDSQSPSGKSASGKSPTAAAGVHCRENERLANRLAGIADDFSRSRRGRAAVEWASGIPLPPTLNREDFVCQLTGQLTDLNSVRCRVAFLLTACSNLTARAVVIRDGAAVLLLIAWCQEMFCCVASACILTRGWSCVIGEDSSGWSPVALALALLLIGCTLGRILRRRCQ